MNQTAKCTYCRGGEGVTKDHVPPRAFFPEKLPQTTQLVTVPCCQACHDRSKKTDGLLRNALISLKDTENHPAITRGLAQKRDRSLARGTTEIEALISLMRKVEVIHPVGGIVRHDWAFDLDTPLVASFAERLIRALLRYEFDVPFFDGHFDWKLNLPMPRLAFEGLVRFGRVRMVHQVFSYGVVKPNDSLVSWAVVNFYGSFEMFIRAQEANEKPLC